MSDKETMDKTIEVSEYFLDAFTKTGKYGAKMICIDAIPDFLKMFGLSKIDVKIFSDLMLLDTVQGYIHVPGIEYLPKDGTVSMQISSIVNSTVY